MSSIVVQKKTLIKKNLMSAFQLGESLGLRNHKDKNSHYEK